MRNLFMLLLFFYSFMAHAQDDSWYKMLKGSIGKYPIVMHLHKSGHLYNGYYYYQSYQQPLSILGEDTSQNGKVHLIVTSAGGAEGEFFQFVLNGDSVKGTWHPTSNTKGLPFTANKSADPLAMAYLYLRGEQPLVPGLPNSPAARSDAAIVWPQTGQGRSDVIKKDVLGFIEEKIEEGDPAYVLRKSQEAYFTRYKMDFANAKPEDLKEMPSAFTSDQTLKALVAYNGNTLLTLALFSYSYTGGAHGNYGTRYTVYNVGNGSRLFLKDVLTPAGVQALPSLLAQAFRKKMGLKAGVPLTKGGLFDNKIKPTDNFLLTGKAIAFNFVPYEVGPYVMGEILLYLPYESIRSYLRPSFVNLLKKN